ncbi:MAG TPA: Flp family type IVb pilin [Rhizomicrobium sp.]|nr:Flp family type IVb pilin [Rhizomicrobium sp.]
MKNFARDIRGATAIEYALVAGLIAMVVITAIDTLGSTLSSTFYAALASVP